jgi:hypothetical protein
MNAKPLLYDLAVATGAATLWFVPADFPRALGYTLSTFFSGRAYLTGVSILAKEEKEDERNAIAYEAETDFYDQLLGSNVEAEIELKTLEVENRMLRRMLPLLSQKTKLEEQLQLIQPQHPEVSEEEKARAAKTAIESAFEADSTNTNASGLSEEEIRKTFPESLDSTSWKAVLKALQSGCTKSEIIKDVFGCSDHALGNAYFQLLKSKFLE